MLSVQRLHQIFFKTVFSVLTYPYWLWSATMLSAKRYHQLFPYEIGCVKYISISKATKEKRFFTLIIEFASLCYVILENYQNHYTRVKLPPRQYFEKMQAIIKRIESIQLTSVSIDTKWLNVILAIILFLTLVLAS